MVSCVYSNARLVSLVCQKVATLAAVSVVTVTDIQRNAMNQDNVW